MKQEDGKPNQSDKNSRAVSMALILVVLCGVSFSLGSIFCSQKYRYGMLDIGNVIPSSKAVAIVPLQIKAVTFPECDSSFQDYTPCTDPKVISVLLIAWLWGLFWYGISRVIYGNDIIVML